MEFIEYHTEKNKQNDLQGTECIFSILVVYTHIHMADQELQLAATAPHHESIERVSTTYHWPRKRLKFKYGFYRIIFPLQFQSQTTVKLKHKSESVST